MARSPLFPFVARALLLARQSLHDERPLPELVGAARDEHLISRRRFLAASALATAGVALEGCAPARTRASAKAGALGGNAGRPVVIVGAGIAGLTAAYRLRQAGVPVRIFEAQSRVGGRMYSLRGFFPDGQLCELGGELIDSGHRHIRALAAELGIALDDLATDDPALARDVWYFGGRRRSDAEVVEAFRPIAAHIERDLATLTGEGDVTYRTPRNAERLDRMSIAEWLDGAAVEGWIRTLLDVGYTTEYGLEIDRQSSLNLLTMIGTGAEDFRIYGESDERYHVRGGNDLIPQALAARLSDAIESGTRLVAVAARGGGPVRLSFERGSSVFDVEADDVLLAIPFTLLRQVQLDAELPAAKQRSIAELGYGTNAKLMVGFSERVWRTRYDSNGSTLYDLPSQLTWETSRLQAGQAGILTNFVGGAHGVALGEGSARGQAARLVSDLDHLFPGISATRRGMKEVRFHWPSFPWTQGSYSSYLPGQWTSICGAAGESVGRLHFAGEHCSLPAQGYMEGGCETGEAAATRILAVRGVRRSGALAAPARAPAPWRPRDPAGETGSFALP